MQQIGAPQRDCKHFFVHCNKTVKEGSRHPSESWDLNALASSEQNEEDSSFRWNDELDQIPELLEREDREEEQTDADDPAEEAVLNDSDDESRDAKNQTSVREGPP